MSRCSLIPKLQRALDNHDISSINKIMPNIFPDYDSNYAEALISYNDDDIKASDLVEFSIIHENTPFIALFVFEEDMIRFMCRNDLNEAIREMIFEYHQEQSYPKLRRIK